jgi:hypothetical protein
LNSILNAWQRWTFTEIPPHIYSLLRILFGVIGCITLIGVSDLATFWDLSGFVSSQDRGLGLKAFLLARDLGDIGGRVLFFASLGAFAAMALGWLSRASVAAALVASLMDLSWNYLPHSGAYVAVQTILFCLIWADCGSVWSLDAWLERRRGIANEPLPYPIAPLQMIRLQVGLIYFSTGLRKLYSEHWRDGSAVHYVLNSTIYRRFPHAVPVSLDPFLTVLTYAILIWELVFLFALAYGPTRRAVLVVGVLMHLGMFATIEIGPFGLVMLASYVAFLDPSKVPALPRTFARIFRR